MRVVLVTLYFLCTVVAATVTVSQVTAAPGPDAFWQEYDHLSVDSLCTPHIPWVHPIWQSHSPILTAPDSDPGTHD